MVLGTSGDSKNPLKRMTMMKKRSRKKRWKSELCTRILQKARQRPLLRTRKRSLRTRTSDISLWLGLGPQRSPRKLNGRSTTSLISRTGNGVTFASDARPRRAPARDGSQPEFPCCSLTTALCGQIFREMRWSQCCVEWTWTVLTECLWPSRTRDHTQML